MHTLLPARTPIATALAAPVAAAVVRRDTGHAAFHGCVDWHSAVHGTWALVAYGRMTGDARYDGVVAAILRPDKLAAERARLAASPGFEMPYGRAWLLRLAREHGLAHGSTHPRSERDSQAPAATAATTIALHALAETALTSLLDYYRHCPPDPRRGSYGSDSWALLNMLDYARWSHNTDAEAVICRLVEAHFLAIDSGCGYDLETGRFMAVTTNWAWLVSRVLPADAFRPWEEAFFAAAGGLPQPVTRPANWHHHGLNFSRAWSLAALAAASASKAARHAWQTAYASHVRATYDTPSLWRGSYRGVGHWVPQFGLLAIQPLFDPQWGCRGAGNSVLSTALRPPERPSGGA